MVNTNDRCILIKKVYEVYEVAVANFAIISDETKNNLLQVKGIALNIVVKVCSFLVNLIVVNVKNFEKSLVSIWGILICDTENYVTLPAKDSNVDD